MSATPFRRVLCLVTAAAALSAVLAPVAGAQSHAGGGCTDPIDGSTMANGKFHYHYRIGQRGKAAIIVVQCKNGNVNVDTVDDPDPIW